MILIKPRLFPIAAAITGTLGSLTLNAGLSLNVESFRDGNIPTGYVNVSDGVQNGEAINVSAEPFLDYLIPNNSGSTGITGQKLEGAYITDSTVADLPGGANNLSNPDAWHVVFEWSDGTPLPFGNDFFGVSWGGFSATETTTLVTRIDLPDTTAVDIFHWFNDGWDYASHETLEGHNLKVALYDESGSLKEEVVEILPSGGAEEIFGDHRQFYTAIIGVSGHNPGDFILITNEAGNVGYKGTAVARGNESPPEASLSYLPGEWSEDPVMGWLIGYTLENWFISTVMGTLYDAYPWLYSPEMGWLLDLQTGTMRDGIFFFSSESGYIWTSEAFGGWYYLYTEDRWAEFPL